MRHLAPAMLLVVAVIHLLPLAGVFGPAQLTSLYGIPFAEPNLAILMRHRAVLFGILGLFFAVAAFRPGLKPAAFVIGFVSVVSFIALAWSVGGYNAQLARICTADLVALACLVIGLVAHLSTKKS